MNIDYVIYSLYISESTYSHRFPDFLTFHQVEVETNSGALAGGFGFGLSVADSPRYSPQNS